MLIQGTNIPIVVTFDSDVSTFPKIVASLWISGKLVKKWEREDMTVSADTIALPLTEEETKSFRRGRARLEIKGQNSSSQIVFWEEAVIDVLERKDKEFDMDG